MYAVDALALLAPCHSEIPMVIDTGVASLRDLMAVKRMGCVEKSRAARRRGVDDSARVSFLLVW